MANLEFSSEIIDYALFRAGEKTDGTSDFNTVALHYLNTNYRKIWMGGQEFDATINEDWAWLRASGIITTVASISAGTASVTTDSSSVTLSTIGGATDVSGYHFKVEGHEDVFRIPTHTAGSTTLTLDSDYTGTTDATANYKIFVIDYTLASDVMNLISPMKTQRDNGKEGRIDGVSLQRIPALHLARAGIAEHFAIIDEAAFGNNTETSPKIRLDKYADTERYRIDYRYKKRPADLTDSATERPLIPLRYRHVLANMVLFDLLVDKNDTRADTVGLIAKQGLKAMAIENRNRLTIIDEEYGYVHPRLEQMDDRERFVEPYLST